MKKFFFCVIIFYLQLSLAQAEVWTVWTQDPLGNVQKTQWETNKTDSIQENSVAFFLRGQAEPLYTVYETTKEIRIVFNSGLTRRFVRGPLVVADIPMPLIMHIPSESSQNHICTEEYTGGMIFRNCMDIIRARSLEDAKNLPTPQAGQMVLVLDDSAELRAIIGSGFRAERQ